MLVCVVGAIAPEARAAIEREGAEVRLVERFDRRNPSANKLRFFPEALATGARGLLLLDCDTAVGRGPPPPLAPPAPPAQNAPPGSGARHPLPPLLPPLSPPPPPPRSSSAR